MEQPKGTSMPNKMKPITITLVCLLAFAAASDSLPSAYYHFLRLAVTTGAGFIALILWQRSDFLRSTGCAGIALAFNPFIPLDMKKDDWFIVDICAAIFLVCTLFSWRDIAQKIKAIGPKKLGGIVLLAAACSIVALFYQSLDDTKMFWGAVFLLYVLSGLPVLSMQNSGSRPVGLLPGSVTLRDWDRRDKRGNRWLVRWNIGLAVLVVAWLAAA